jgi:multidrug resistance efflux pump
MAKANAGIQQAQAQLDAVQAAARAGDVGAAEAEVRRAQAQLDLAKAGPRPESVQAAEAGVAAAQAEVDRAQADLASTELKAPFGGTIVTLDAKAGEQVGAGQVAARLADVSAWQVETINLTELNVAHVKVGQPATLAFDAVPELKLAGKVTSIRGLGENRQGDTVYTVVVTPDGSDPALRWNMTVQVTFGQ